MKNKLKEMLKGGEVALGVTITIGHPDVSEVLGNTPAVARGSYIDPRVFDRFLSGATIAGGGASPAAAIERAQGLWRIFGHAGAVAFVRTSDFEIGKFNDKRVLRRFGQVTDEYR